MVINIYYGGRGLIDDPTLAVLARITAVLGELRVKVNRYYLHDMKNNIMTLPQTLKDADGVILASTVEWSGIGGYMHLFLDACWQYGDKAKISGTYMFPVVMSRAYGEKEGALELMNAWEMLGGKACSGLSGYIDETVDLETNATYIDIIEKKAEEMYRSISQKFVLLPSSCKAIKQNIVSDTINLTPQETEQLSRYASDDKYVKQQKQDIEALASVYKTMLDDEAKGGDDHYINALKEHYVPKAGFTASYMIQLSNKGKAIILEIDNKSLNCYFGQKEDASIIAKLSGDSLDEIIEGRMTFQRAFMTGEMTARGSLNNIRMLDESFSFS